MKAFVRVFWTVLVLAGGYGLIYSGIGGLQHAYSVFSRKPSVFGVAYLLLAVVFVLAFWTYFIGFCGPLFLKELWQSDSNRRNASLQHAPKPRTENQQSASQGVTALPSPADISEDGISDFKGEMTSRHDFVFFEHHTTLKGTPLTTELLERTQIDFPTYYWDQGRNAVVSSCKLGQPSPEVRLLYGFGTTLTGALGGGTASRLVFVSTLPFTNSDVTLRHVTEDGTVHYSFREELLSLKPGDSLVRQLKKIQHQGTAIYVLEEEQVFTNRGRIDRTRIVER